MIDPDDMTRDYLLKKREEQLRLQRLLETLKGQPNVTKDGKSIRIYCNIGSPDDVHAVQVNDGGGIGLFRSEFLYLNSPDYPTEDQQFEAYKGSCRYGRQGSYHSHAGYRRGQTDRLL